jgi:hypothetical protein
LSIFTVSNYKNCFTRDFENICWEAGEAALRENLDTIPDTYQDFLR